MGTDVPRQSHPLDDDERDLCDVSATKKSNKSKSRRSSPTKIRILLHYETQNKLYQFLK